jgi:3-ketoacyl-CoA synthase
MFALIPSFTDMIINRYGMRPDISNAHLSGTGWDGMRLAVL